MKYFSMFSGIGGFEFGLNSAYKQIRKCSDSKDGSSSETGSESQLPSCVGFSEIDKYAIAIYQHHFPEHKNYGDATRIIPESIPDFDMLVGGFPCQAFSIAGKRLGFNETRGTLFFDIARILKVKKPRNFVLENVKGLLSHDDGRTFKTIIHTLIELGYDVEWQVLNSKNHGVPQNRERVFIVGHLGGFSGREIFPFTEGGGIFETADGADSGRTQAEVSHTLRGPNVKADQVFIKETQKLPDAQRVRETDGLATTLKGLGGGQGAKTGLYAIPVLTPDRPNKRQNGRRFKDDGDPAFTVTAQDKHGVFDGFRIRRLTPPECERLQAFPDGWTKLGKFGDEVKEISDSQRYKCLGNSVTTSVIQAIMERII